ncbi:hypothetical protein [Streptomyces sp. NBC_00096]|uniref:hypothetical protein n=1 Tax=Streptomyces sp. NBC_00096 TaxID=2975650 RepID=UPI003249213E
MDNRSLHDTADRAQFSLLLFDLACAEGDCTGMRRALLSLALCMREMGDPHTAAELQALAERHRAHGAWSTAERRFPRQLRGKPHRPRPS